MNLLKYFDTDDGSLPEITVTFADSESVIKAFELLFACGARNVTINGGLIWLVASQSERPYSGTDDALLVISGAAHPFHVVLAGVTCADHSIPDLGVFVDSDSLTIDYRMGPSWGEPQVKSLLALLRHLCELGGVVSVPWWGAEGERSFLDALGGA